jgi:hypothetical protein
MTLITTALVAHQYLVEGKDSGEREGSTILDGTQFDEIALHEEHGAAHEDFDRAVERFFAPLTDAADRLTAKHEADEDPLSYYEISRETEATEARPAERISLTHDTMVLRALLRGAASVDRVRWVGADKLAITKADAWKTATTTPPPSALPDFIEGIIREAEAKGATVNVDTYADGGTLDITLPAEEDYAAESKVETVPVESPVEDTEPREG